MQETRPDQDPGSDTAQRPTSHSLRLTLLVLLLVLLIAAIAAVAYLAATRPVPALGLGGDQDAVQAQRESAMAQAEQFMLRVNTYGPDELDGDTMPKYRKLVEEVITPKFAVDFEKSAPLAEGTVKQAGVQRAAQVFSTGVSAIDSDSATALVAGQVTNTFPRRLRDQIGDLCPVSGDRLVCPPSGFRVQVSLVKVKGKWLVDDFIPLTGDDATDTGDGTLPPGTDLTPGATEPPASAPTEGSSP
jgi:Mce-associated membrane protein